MGQDLFTAEQFINAIKGSGGIISTIALRVGCSWNTANKYIHEKPTVQKAYDDERETVNDLAVSVLIKTMQQTEDTYLSVASAKWWLERKRKEEYSPRQENLNIDLTLLSDDQLEMIKQGKSLTDVLKHPGA